MEKHYMYGTCTEKSNGRRIERPLHISLLNSSQKASRYATRREINNADGSIIAACKLQQYFYFLVARYYIWTCRMRETNPKIEGHPSLYLPSTLRKLSPNQMIFVLFVEMRENLSSIFSGLVRRLIFSGKTFKIG